MSHEITCIYKCIDSIYWKSLWIMFKAHLSFLRDQISWAPRVGFSALHLAYRDLADSSSGVDGPFLTHKWLSFSKIPLSHPVMMLTCYLSFPLMLPLSHFFFFQICSRHVIHSVYVLKPIQSLCSIFKCHYL